MTLVASDCKLAGGIYRESNSYFGGNSRKALLVNVSEVSNKDRLLSLHFKPADNLWSKPLDTYL